mgnify:FL=1
MVSRKTRQFVGAAVESLTLAIELFNRPSQLGREHATVMMAAHAFEMLLKAVIYEERKKVGFKSGDRSFGLGKCIDVAMSGLGVIDAGDRVVLRTLREERNDATHDFITISDDVLWLQLRSAVTIFRKVLLGLTGQDLSELMPGRVLPVSATPPTDVALVVGKEVEQIMELLTPSKRRGAEARARLLPIMALDRAARGIEGSPSETEIKTVMDDLKARKEWKVVFPGVVGLRVADGSESSDLVQEISLKIDPKRGDLPVRLAREGEDAVAYREVDTFDRYSIKLSEFGPKLGLNRYQGYAVIDALELRSDEACYLLKRTRKGNVQFQGLSPKALDRARKALADDPDLVERAVDDYKRARASRSRSRGRR